MSENKTIRQNPCATIIEHLKDIKLVSLTEYIANAITKDIDNRGISVAKSKLVRFLVAGIVVLVLLSSGEVFAQETSEPKWVLAETLINPENKPTEFIVGVTPNFFSSRFDGSFDKYTIEETYFIHKSYWKDHVGTPSESLEADVEMRADFTKPPEILVPGEKITLKATVSATGTSPGRGSGIIFEYRADGINLRDTTQVSTGLNSEPPFSTYSISPYFVVPETHSGEISIGAFLWNAGAANVRWIYRVQDSTPADITPPDISSEEACNDLCYKKCGSECYGAVDGGDCYCYYEPYSVSIDRNEEDCDELCRETYGSECYGLVDGSDCYCYYKLEMPDITPPDISSGEQVEEEDGNSDAAPKLTNEQKEKVKEILGEALSNDSISEEERALIQLIGVELAKVGGQTTTATGGIDALITVISKGGMPTIEQIEKIWTLGTLRDIGSLVRDRRQKTEKDHVWGSKILGLNGITALDSAIDEIKDGENRTIKVEKVDGENVRITVVKGPDGTISYTLDGKKYFGGGDIDRKLNPGMWRSASDYIGDVWDKIQRGLGVDMCTKKNGRCSPDEKNMYALAMDIHQEFGVNANANKNLQEQLRGEMGNKVFSAIQSSMQTAVKSGEYAADKMTSLGVSAIDYSVTTLFDQTIRGDFAELAVEYCTLREEGKSQEIITYETGGLMNPEYISGAFKGHNANVVIRIDENPQILYDQFEKVYQRYKISKELNQ